jgi:hypothetical protein
MNTAASMAGRYCSNFIDNGNSMNWAGRYHISVPKYIVLTSFISSSLFIYIPWILTEDIEIVNDKRTVNNYTMCTTLNYYKTINVKACNMLI